MIGFNDIKPFMEGKLTEAPPIGIDSLDKYIRFKKNFTLVGGIAGTGKTTAWIYVLYAWASLHPEDLKFVIFANENDRREVAMQVIEWRTGKWITELTKEEVESSLKWVNHHFMFLKNNYNTNVKKLLSTLKNIKEGNFEGVEPFNYDGVFIDPYSSLEFGSYHEHYQNASDLRAAVKTLDAKVMVSMHVRSESQRKRDEQGMVSVPHIADIEMGSMFLNRCDDAVTIHRQIQVEELKYITEIHVQKIKHYRSGGEATPFDEPIRMTWSSGKAGRFIFSEGDKAPSVVNGIKFNN